MDEEKFTSLIQESLMIATRVGAANAPATHQFKVYIAGQIRRVTAAIKRELRRRPAVEPVIGHLKEDYRMSRNFLAYATGDVINAILAAAGYNLRHILAC